MDVWAVFGGDPWVVAACALAVGVGALVQGVLGFGLALLSVPVLAWLAPDLVPVGVLVAVMPLVLVSAVRERSHVDLRGIGWAMVGRVPGGAAGAVAVALLPVRGLQLLVAATVCLAVVAAVVADRRPRAPRPSPRRSSLVVAGVLSGVGGTTSGIGGPPMAITFRNSGGPAIRSTLAAFFAVGAVLSLASLAVVDELTVEKMLVGLVLVPPVVLGYLLAGPLRRRVQPAVLRLAVLVLSGAAGLALLLVALPS
ncbi:TSUP family transporter [Aquipuribacter sp. MA13-6]|uniref:TSUP family transporter n=1 Tax=unclassified Aquipuribacter TaxID=2635084 RepID=UPI003EEBA69D